MDVNPKKQVKLTIIIFFITSGFKCNNQTKGERNCTIVIADGKYRAEVVNRSLQNTSYRNFYCAMTNIKAYKTYNQVVIQTGPELKMH